MARQYSRELWARVKGLFISGCSVRDIARQCGIPAGSVAARCARESRSARLLAEKALAAVEKLSINGFEEIREAQGFRQNLWPAVAPQSSQPIENKTTLTLYFDHERPEVTEGKEPPLRITMDGKPAAPGDSLSPTPSEKPKD